MMKKPTIVLSNYLFILCLMFLIVSLYLKTNPTYMKGLYLLVLALLLAQAHVAFLKRKLSFYASNQEISIMSKKEGNDFTLGIRNDSFLESPYIHIFLKPSYHATAEIKQLCVTVPPHSYKEFKVPYKGEYAGTETLKVEKIVIQDFFEVAKRKVKKELLQEVAVLPEVTSIKNFDYLFRNMRSRTEGKETSRVVGPQGEVSQELKNYQEGDSLRLVHWKLVARRDVYMVRQREEEIGAKKDYTIILDPIYVEENEEERARGVDKTLVSCISIIEAILKKEEKVSLLYARENRWELIELSNLSKIEEVAKLIGCYGMTNAIDSSLERWPRKYLIETGKSTTSKLLITAQLSAKLVDDIEEEKGLNVLEMKRSHYEDEFYGFMWYMSDEYEVIRSV